MLDTVMENIIFEHCHFKRTNSVNYNLALLANGEINTRIV